MTRTAAILGSVAMIALIGGLWLMTLRGAPQDALTACRKGAVAGDMGGPFELVNSRGETVTDRDVITEPSLVYFGYTFCPDVCPLDAVRNADAVDALQERGISATPIFISIDPKRDTPEVVGEFAFNIHDKMIGLTGSASQVDAASKAYRTYYKAQQTEDDYYLVDHTTFTYVVFPKSGFVDYVRRETTPEQVADRVACFAKAGA